MDCWRHTQIVVLVLSTVTVGCSKQPRVAEHSGVLRLVPDLTIGNNDGGNNDDGDDAYLFTDIRSLAVAPNGDIIIVDRVGHVRNPPLKVFSSDGSFVRYVGGPGDGPGEFQYTWSVDVVDDRIIVADTRQFETFNLDGTFVSSQEFGVLQVFSSLNRLASAQVVTTASYYPEDDDGERPERIRAVFLLDSELDSGTRVADLDLFYDLSLPFEQRASQPSFAINTATRANRVILGPGQFYTCKLVQLEPVGDGAVRTDTLRSNHCTDRGYRTITKEQFDEYSDLARSDWEAVPGAPIAMFSRGTEEYGLLIRRPMGLFFLEDGSLVNLVVDHSIDHLERAERFDSSGGYLGLYEVDGISARSRLMATDAQHRLYFTSKNRDGVPIVTRYRAQLCPSASSNGKDC